MKVRKALLLAAFIILTGALFVACDEAIAPPAHEHTVITDEPIAATCESAGLTSGTHCSECGEIIVAQRPIANKGHTESEWIIDKEATMSSEGKTHTECTVCGKIIREDTIPKIVVSDNASKGLEFTLDYDSANYSSSSYTVIGIGTCTDTEIVIPSTYNGKPVTAIRNKAFEDCRSLTKVTIPDSITNIGDYAFSGCDSLKNIVIGNSVTNIGDRAFYQCDRITRLVIPQNVTSIGTAAFEGCHSLGIIIVENGNTVYHSSGNCVIETATKTLVAGCKNSVIPTDGSVTSIGDYAFTDCYSITSLVYPDFVTSIFIPDSITSIGDYAFYGCDSLTSIVIPDSVTSIGQRAFGYCNSLESITVEQENTFYHSTGNCLIKKTTNTLIAGCKNSVIPADGSVTSIDDYAFSGRNLTSIVIPDTVTNIGSYAFGTCTKLTNVTIPSSVVSIGNNAFYNCYNLLYNTYDNAYYLGSSSNPYLVLIKAKSVYITSCKINLNTKFIYTKAFEYCNSITSIVIPDSVTSIGDSAFSVCTRLTSVVIPDSVTSIGDRAFEDCYNLTSIEFDGTKAQWDAILKGDFWNYHTGSDTVHCTDGDIAKANS